MKNKDLWEKAYKKDRRAVVAIIQDTLKYHCEDVEDLVQDTYTRAWEKLASYQPDKSSFLTWLCNIAKSVTVNYIEEQAALKRPDLVYDVELRGVDDDDIVVGYDDLVHDPADDPSNLVEGYGEWEYALSRMSEQMRHSVRMRGEGYSNAEIADSLDISEKTVRNLISASRQFFRDNC